MSQISGLDFANYSLLFPTLFTAESGIISTDPANGSFVIGSKIAQPVTDGPVYFTVGDNLTMTFRNETSMEMINYTAPVSAILSEMGDTSSFGAPSDSGIYLQVGIAEVQFNTTNVNSILVFLTSDSSETITYVTNLIETYYDNQVSVMSPTSMIDMLSSAFSTIELFIVAIASIALLVAGIGIMNIQIVSVLERTREIGILKAIGAKDRSVLSVFLVETLFIGFIGAAVGTVFGWLISLLLGQTIGSLGLGGAGGIFGGGPGMGGSTGGTSLMDLTITPVITLELVLEALGFGLLVALIFGVYPAWRASRLKPVDALRHE